MRETRGEGGGGGRGWSGGEKRREGEGAERGRRRGRERGGRGGGGSRDGGGRAAVGKRWKRDNLDNGDNGDGGNNSFKHGGGYNQDSQQTGSMSWAQRQDNYYATQDTDHGHRPSIEAQRQFLNNLTQFSSEDTFSHHSGSQRYRGIDDQMQNLGIHPTYEHESSQNCSTSQLRYGYDQLYGITPDYYSGYRSFDGSG
ncbi:transcription initiation factor TFIID subunit 15b-like [Coffea eugenioides]|uniref:transcription initiation factor TFIID subunit 15b-like n=1 Tax=Coffea eugenioides TaxID=49369 RepID=UPI000F61586D|nr:transcription initiation factor TFIID subunit 15b-like [Coffea eugenioides]